MGEYIRDVQTIVKVADKLTSYIYDESKISKRIYPTTLEKYIHIQQDLEECLGLIRGMIASTESDSFEIYDEVDATTSLYTPKVIMTNYFKKFAVLQLVDYGENEEAAEFSLILCEWFKARFTSNNPNFFYKADRISEWIDLIILSYGRALHERLTEKFKKDFNEWLTSVYIGSNNWPVPSFIYEISSSAFEEDYTEEAVKLEKAIKAVLYDVNFYPDRKETVKELVSKHGASSRKVI